MITIKRAYEKPDKSDGMRILVDRLWPRGISKAALKLDRWEKEIAPNSELRTWFGHDPKRWGEFKKKYKAELKHADKKALLHELSTLARKHAVTLVYGAKDTEHNHALVLAEVLKTKL